MYLRTVWVLGRATASNCACLRLDAASPLHELHDALCCCCTDGLYGFGRPPGVQILCSVDPLEVLYSSKRLKFCLLFHN